MTLDCRTALGLCLAGMLSIPVSAESDDLRLVQAVRADSPASAIGALLEQGVDVNGPEPDGATPLQWAAHRDNLEIADVLISAGADVNAANEYGVTPLSLACVNRSTAMVGKLLKAGADANKAQWTGETPLIGCSRTGNVETVKQLLAAGANVNAKETQQGQTALMRAVAAKHPEVTRALIAAGADVHAESKGGFTALLFASQQGDVESARLLVDAGARINEVTVRGPEARRDFTGGECVPGTARYAGVKGLCFVPTENPVPLVMAAASGREEVAMLLLERGANPNAMDPYGWTALHQSVPEGWASISAFFYRPFHDELRRPNMPNLVKALLAHGADPNVQVQKDFSAYSASQYALVTKPAGLTPLLLAAASGDVTIMRTLVEAGGNLKVKLKDGTTALMLAAGVGRTQDRRTKQEEAGAFETVKLLIELGADVNAVNEAGRTALHGAASVGAVDVIQLLAEKGAKLDIPDKRGLTPYGVAAGASTGEDSSERIYPPAMELLVKLAGKPLEKLIKPPAPEKPAAAQGAAGKASPAAGPRQPAQAPAKQPPAETLPASPEKEKAATAP